MSGIDPLAALSARVAAAEAAMLEAAIDLGVSADVLQAQISTGDILAAKILPPQNGQDLIEILGQRVAAQLPPGIHPGETLLLQVTGFSGMQIFVRNLGTPDPRNPLPVAEIVLTQPESEEPAQSAVLATVRTPQQQTQQQPVSPSRAVFVAASVQQAPQAAAQQAQSQSVPTAAAFVQGIEARIAAAQAAKLPPVVTPQTHTQTPAARTQRMTMPLIPARTAAAQTAAASAVQRVVQTVSEFLRAARLPDTPFTRMAATIAPQAPERLPSVLQRLESALPRVSDDARISTLRTLIGFTARLSPANAETLRAQISSYVSNVVEGVEVKLSQLLAAHAQTQTPSAPVSPATPQQAQQAQPAPPQQNGEPPQIPPTIAQARVAERSAAIAHDLKSVVLSLLRDPPAAKTSAMTQALGETLITLTGVQVSALSANQQNPGTFNFALPVYYHEGGKPAQLRISRDTQSGAARMDADNFHVAFVLDTANLGTVAIDLHTTGRAVKVDVKTENKHAAERFADTLSSLRGRLEDLRYRVASAAANVLPAHASKKEPTAKAAPSAGRPRGLDLQA